MERILVDTNILIDYLRGRPDSVSFVQEHESRICVSAVVVAELYAGVREGKERGVLEDMVDLFPVLDVTVEIAEKAGLIRREYKASHGVCVADAIVAATASMYGVRLATLNLKHFPMVETAFRPYEMTRVHDAVVTYSV